MNAVPLQWQGTVRKEEVPSDVWFRPLESWWVEDGVRTQGFHRGCAPYPMNTHPLWLGVSPSAPFLSFSTDRRGIILHVSAPCPPSACHKMGGSSFRMPSSCADVASTQTTPRDGLERLTTARGRGDTPPPLGPDFIVGKNEIHKSKY